VGEDGISVERLLGNLEGQQRGILDSLARIEQNQRDHMQRTDDAMDDQIKRLSALEVAQAEDKGRWKLLAGLSTIAGFGGAGAKHILEKFL